MDAKTGSASRLDRPFVGVPSFLRSPIVQSIGDMVADVAVVGVPTDEGCPFMPGARFAPRAIREHSLRFAGSRGWYDARLGRQMLQYEMENQRIVDFGDVDIVPTNIGQTFENITETIKGIIKRGIFPIILGGDHSISFPAVRAFDDPLYVFQFDAHLDYAPVRNGLAYTNGHPFRHIKKLAHVVKLIQVGIRSLRNTKEMTEESIADGNTIISMDEFRSGRSIVELIPQGARCYVSIDIDVFDLSLVPGCVSAEPDGMTYHDLSNALRLLAERATIVGFDLVEVNPQLDVGTQVTSYLAAHTIIEFLGRICDQPSWKEPRGRQ